MVIAREPTHQNGSRKGHFLGLSSASSTYFTGWRSGRIKPGKLSRLMCRRRTPLRPEAREERSFAWLDPNHVGETAPPPVDFVLARSGCYLG